MAMNKETRQTVQALRSLAEACGARLVETDRRARHYQATFERGGKRTVITIGGTASDHRAAKNTISMARRALASLPAA